MSFTIVDQYVDNARFAQQPTAESITSVETAYNTCPKTSLVDEYSTKNYTNVNGLLITVLFSFSVLFFYIVYLCFCFLIFSIILVLCIDECNIREKTKQFSNHRANFIGHSTRAVFGLEFTRTTESIHAWEILN